MRDAKSGAGVSRREWLGGALALTAAARFAPLRAGGNARWSAFATVRGTEQRLAPIDPPPLANGSGGDTLVVDPARRAQRLVGFGGALTEASAYVLDKLPRNRRNDVLQRYYDAKDGIGYTLARTHFTSCDFSRASWSLDEEPNDTALKHFSLRPLRERQLPLIHDVYKRVGATKFKLLGSPWSPPAWMKTNGDMAHGGRLKPNLAETWAQHYVHFARAMRDEEKLPLWALTVQNEPDAAQPWESCLYSPYEERGFIADALGPALEEAKLGVKLFGWDHNRNGLEERANVLLGDARSAKYLAGLAVHWYQTEDFAASRRVLQRFPDAQILFTEGCAEGGPHRDAWEPAERYARNIIGDLSNGVCGWIDWNIALDLAGGPNHVGNFCHAPVLIDTERGEAHFQPSFHYIAHFSKFAPPGSTVLTLGDIPAGLQALAFATPDEALVAVVCNPGDAARDFALDLGGERRACSIPGHAIQTYRKARD